MDFSEKWAKDIDEAVRLALMDLKLTEDQVNVIVLEEPTRGFFGLGSKLAKVRVEKKIEPKEEKKEFIPENKSQSRLSSNVKNDEKIKNEKTKVEIKPEKKAIKASEESKFSFKEKPKDLIEIKDGPALDFLFEIIDKMGLKLGIRAYQNEDSIYVEIEGKDSGTIIGKRGQTLDAIQYLTSLVVNKNKEKYIRVIIDAENYRQKREKTLEQLANRLADKVLKTNKSVRLEPMNPYERKVIHATLQLNPDVTTRSEGEEPFRRVIIERK
ncbi:RNA-binding cell elongation regulator Jag/EloR [Anaerovorax odorimutans]|uniref:RNA-binding cell elongation regulator Jag/EloR n=1 Tax=Anaerovorax odorimutans TaxID=109327 RepID=UPI0004154DDE|nr:RNA-binding cell elongation regulator Jag/EloR [Anaerovorax odorimutans]